MFKADGWLLSCYFLECLWILGILGLFSGIFSCSWQHCCWKPRNLSTLRNLGILGLFGEFLDEVGNHATTNNSGLNSVVFIDYILLFRVMQLYQNKTKKQFVLTDQIKTFVCFNWWLRNNVRAHNPPNISFIGWQATDLQHL